MITIKDLVDESSHTLSPLVGIQYSYIVYRTYTLSYLKYIFTWMIPEMPIQPFYYRVLFTHADDIQVDRQVH